MAKVNDYLTVGEAAEFLGVSKDTLCRWDRARKLRAHRHPITGCPNRLIEIDLPIARTTAHARHKRIARLICNESS
jgi:excisionase family DNA binding protein